MKICNIDVTGDDKGFVLDVTDSNGTITRYVIMLDGRWRPAVYPPITSQILLHEIETSPYQLSTIKFPWH